VNTENKIGIGTVSRRARKGFLQRSREYIDSSTASLKITDLAVQRGYGFFDYLDRFYNSGKGLNLIVPLLRS